MPADLLGSQQLHYSFPNKIGFPAPIGGFADEGCPDALLGPGSGIRRLLEAVAKRDRRQCETRRLRLSWVARRRSADWAARLSTRWPECPRPLVSEGRQHLPRRESGDCLLRGGRWARQGIPERRRDAAC